MSRSTKFIVIVSNLVALWLTTTLVSRGIPSILVPTAVVFTVSWCSAFLLGDIVTSVVLSTIYLVPAVCFAWFHNFIFSYYTIWLAGLCGAMLPRTSGSAWAYPGRFAGPLVFWALVLALSWPIIVLREADFFPALLGPAGMSVSLPGAPGIIAIWVANVTAVALTGLLLLDWLFLVYSADRLRAFESRVIWPLFAGAIPGAVVAVYQALVDITFLNQTLFGNIGRAVGTMRDANPFGASMALWLPVAAAMALTSAGRWLRTVAWSAIFVILAIAVWASGSRTALLAALIGLFVVMVHARRLFPARQALAGLLVIVVFAATTAWLVPSTTWTRARAMVPSISISGLRSFAYQLWSRDTYGTAAVQMIAEHPLVGVGVGGFNYQYGEVLQRLGHTELPPPDNAQNWYRQQLAELGVVGSLGWIAWIAVFIWMLMRCPDPDGTAVRAGAAKGAIFGLAAASMLGMPTLDAAASISFVVVMCWCVKLKGAGALARLGDAGRVARREWVAMLLVLGCFLGGTLYAARTDLRAPVRALRINFPYRYGFEPDRRDPTIRWTGARAVEVFPADKRWFKLELGAVAPDAAEKPVQVQVWINRTLILRVNRRGDFPIARWIRMPSYGTFLMIEIDVDRTWRPAEPGGSADERERGVAVREWYFTDDDPPKGSVTVESPDVYSR